MFNGNINTFQIKPLVQECCGFDVDANEDGCNIISCDCKVCTKVINISNDEGKSEKWIPQTVIPNL